MTHVFDPGRWLQSRDMKKLLVLIAALSIVVVTAQPASAAPQRKAASGPVSFKLLDISPVHATLNYYGISPDSGQYVQSDQAAFRLRYTCSGSLPGDPSDFLAPHVGMTINVGPYSVYRYQNFKLVCDGKRQSMNVDLFRYNEGRSDVANTVYVPSARWSWSQAKVYVGGFCSYNGCGPDIASVNRPVLIHSTGYPAYGKQAWPRTNKLVVLNPSALP